MNKTYIEANGVKLDTFDDLSVSLNYAIEDILDITKRNTSFSKTINIPGTPLNNQFFYQIFDVNIDNINFNPAISIPAAIRVDDNVVMEGVLQLLNVINVNGELQYEVVVRGKLGDILSNMSDYSLQNLDLSEYNHIRNQQNIYQSWFYNIRSWNTLVNYNSPGIGYVYPYIIYDTASTSNATSGPSSYSEANALYIFNMYPSIYVRTLIRKMFEFAGYTYTSDFFDSDYFAKLILPYTQDKIQLSDSVIEERTAIVGVNGSQIEHPGGTVTGYRSLTDGAIVRGSDWYYNSSFSYHMPLLRESGFVSSLEYTDDLNQWAEYGGFTANSNGYYDIDMDLQLFAKYECVNSYLFRWNGNGFFKYYYKIRVIRTNGQVQDIYSSVTPLEFQPSDNVSTHTNSWYDLDNPLVMNGSAQNVWLAAGDKVVIFFAARYPQTGMNWAGVDDDDVRLRMVVKESFNQEPSFLTIKPSSNVDMGNQLIDMNQMLPNIKMKDFFLDIVKMFNLIVQDNPNKKNDLLIEPRDDFFKSKQKVLDWNLIIDNDSEIKITPMSELDARSYIFTYKEDDDYYNEQYTDETKEIYSSLRIDVENDFSNQERKLELLFSPTPDADYGNATTTGTKVAPIFMTKDGDLWKQKKVKPRILFYGGAIAPDSSNAFFATYIQLKDFYGQPTSDSTTSAVYPYCGMFDHPYTPNYDLGFGRTKKLYWDTDQLPVNNLYEQFHKATLDNIVDINSRLLEAYFYLTPKDIAEFDFRDIIFLNGQYWRVNKIENFNPAGADNLTKVILYKIVDIDFFKDGRISLPESNKPCPTDVVAKRTKTGYVYVSASGQYLSADCCKAIGGLFVDGVCKVRRKPIGVNPVKPILFKQGGPEVVPISDKNGPQELSSGGNTGNVGRNIVLGNSNVMFGDGNVALGSDNTILPGVKNAIIIGDGITADESDTMYIGDVKIDSNGNIIRTGLLITDGGEDTIYPFEKTNPVDIIDGGVNSVRNPGGYQLRNRNIVDGDNPA